MATRKEKLTKSVDVGKALAKKALDRRKKAARARKIALARIDQPMSHGIASGPKALTATVATPQLSAGTLVAEGDSWFDYPLHDVLSNLEDIYGFDVESVAHKGDTVEDMAYSEGQLDAFARRVEKLLRSGIRPRAILLSGGGNDIAGDEFAILLNHAASSISGLNESIVAGVIDQRLRDAYATIISAITSICTVLTGQPVPIIVHGYDYAVPDGRGFAGGWGPLPGPWLEPGFRRKGYDYETLSITKPIVANLIDRFNLMLGGLAGKSPFAHVYYLDLRNTLSSGSKYKDSWANELHPSSEGFEAVTARFASLIATL